jgi:hypothetical protein
VRATITPSVPHVAIAATAAARVRDEGLADAVEPGFCSARSNEDLAAIADEHIQKAALHLVWAAHCREMLAAREQAEIENAEKAAWGTGSA